MASSTVADLPDIPRYVRILGHHWKVKLTADLKDGVVGTTNPETRTIKIDQTQDSAHRWETFLHEFGHAVLDELGVENTSLHEDLEELIVEHIAAQMFRAVLRPLLMGKVKKR